MTLKSVSNGSITLHQKTVFYQDKHQRISFQSTWFRRKQPVFDLTRIRIEGSNNCKSTIASLASRDSDFYLDGIETRNCECFSERLAGVNIYSRHSGTSESVIENSSFNGLLGSAISIEGSFESVTVFGTMSFSTPSKLSVRKSTNVEIESNSVIGVLSAESEEPQINFEIKVENYPFFEDSNVKVTENFVSSVRGFGVGFSIPGSVCQDKTHLHFEGNSDSFFIENDVLLAATSGGWG